MDRRNFFGCIGKMLMMGAVTVFAEEILEPEPEVNEKPWTKEQMEMYLELVRTNKPTFTLAS